jgi:hypothetical protein
LRGKASGRARDEVVRAVPAWPKVGLACREFRNYVRLMREPLNPVYDDFGRQIGTVQRVELGRSKSTFWQARSLDGADLGSHADRDEAHAAIRLDWALGRPRNPKSGERYRPVHAGLDAGVQPVYLGR